MASIRKRVWRRPDGTIVERWQVTYTVNGKRRAKQFSKKKAATAWMHSTAVAVSAGVHTPARESVTVETVAGQWLEHLSREVDAKRLERSTVASYEQHVRLHILADGVATLKLTELTRGVCNAFRGRLLTNRSPAMTRKILTSLALLIDYAKDHDLVSVNNARGIKLRRARHLDQGVVVPSKMDVARLINTAEGQLRPLLIVSVFCGLRATELYALRWVNVDLKNNIIRVVERIDRYGVVGPPKSKAGERSVPIGGFVRNTLRSLWAERTGELVFSNSHGRPWRHTHIAARRFKPLLAQCGIADMKWHSFRHFSISTWIEAGYTAKSIMSFAGHSSIQMTFDRYGHLFPQPEDDHATMGRIEQDVLSSV